MGWGKSIKDVSSALMGPGGEGGGGGDPERDARGGGEGGAGGGGGEGGEGGEEYDGYDGYDEGYSGYDEGHSAGPYMAGGYSSAAGPYSSAGPSSAYASDPREPSAGARKKRGGRRVREAEERRAAKAKGGDDLAGGGTRGVVGGGVGGGVGAGIGAGVGGGVSLPDASPYPGADASPYPSTTPLAAPTPTVPFRGPPPGLSERALGGTNAGAGAARGTTPLWGALGGVAWEGPIADIQRSASTDVLHAMAPRDRRGDHPAAARGLPGSIGAARDAHPGIARNEGGGGRGGYEAEAMSERFGRLGGLGFGAPGERAEPEPRAER